VCLWRRVEDEMARNIGNPQPLSVRIMINAESGAPGCGVRSDKWVLVANHTQTLDVLATMCRGLGLGMLRIDGSTPASQRQGLVRPLSVFCFLFLFLFSVSGPSSVRGFVWGHRGTDPGLRRPPLPPLGIDHDKNRSSD
jgi:hypothetical protein